MRTLTRLRPSPAMIVAVAALIVAIGGTAYAAHLINGKLVKKGSLPADRIKRHSITGNQMNLRKLGKVPSSAASDHAALADSAGIAGTANLAKNADSATNAFLAQRATNADSAGNANTIAGTNMARMFAKLSDGAAPKTLVDTGFVKISSSCSGGSVGVTATSELDHQEATNRAEFMSGSTSTSHSNDWAAGTNVGASGPGPGVGHLEVATPDGRILSAVYSFDVGSAFGGAASDCAVSGTATWG